MGKSPRDGIIGFDMVVDLVRQAPFTHAQSERSVINAKLIATVEDTAFAIAFGSHQGFLGQVTASELAKACDITVFVAKVLLSRMIDGVNKRAKGSKKVRNESRCLSPRTEQTVYPLDGQKVVPEYRCPRCRAKSVIEPCSCLMHGIDPV